MSNLKTNNYQFYTPRYWPAWIAVGILWLLSQLPYSFLLILGKHVGLIMHRFCGKLKHIAKTNVDLCFPELTSAAKEKLLRENFVSLGISIFESGLAWFGSNKKLLKLKHSHYEGVLDQLEKTDKGSILLGAHFMTLEIIGRLFAHDHDFVIIYRANKNSFVDYLLTRVCRRHYPCMIERSNIRAILKALKNGGNVWYTPDIDAGYYNNVFVPFFGILASSLTAPARMAKLTGAKVIPTAYYRRDDGTGYDLFCFPALNDFPSENLDKDISRVNQSLEDAIRKKPEQYLWQYKRFKTRPEGEPRFYKKEEMK
jgi:Kdo2-lipid IVA lauroyltransferase/acyltransferase